VPEENQVTPDEERPPFGRTWGNLYLGVLLTLAVLIALFYLFTLAFR
jgi:hypothetical protein